MACGFGVGEQLAWMLNVVKRCNQNNLSTCLNEEPPLSSLTYPLLPLLPLQPPPSLLAELLRETDNTTEDKGDKCEMCGKNGKNFVTCCLATPLTSPVRLSETELSRNKQVEEKNSSLDRTMKVIEQKFEETLKSIEQTTARCNELNWKTKQLNNTKNEALSDAELLRKLKYLVKEKTKLVHRVQALEKKEEQLKNFLITELTLIKPKSREQIQINSKENTGFNQGGQILDQQRYSSQESIDSKVNSTPRTSKSLTKDVNLSQETISEKEISEIIIDEQYLLEKGSSDENVNFGQSNGSESEIIVINNLGPPD